MGEGSGKSTWSSLGEGTATQAALQFTSPSSQASMQRTISAAAELAAAELGSVDDIAGAVVVLDSDWALAK